jgi:hypothetical protein
MCRVIKTEQPIGINSTKSEPEQISAVIMNRKNSLTTSGNSSTESVHSNDISHEVQDLIHTSKDLVSSLTVPKSELVDVSRETMTTLLNTTSDDLIPTPPIKLSTSDDLIPTPPIKLSISDDLLPTPPIKLSTSDDLLPTSPVKLPKSDPVELEPMVSKEEFDTKLTGITTKGKAIFDKLDPSLQKLAFDAIPSTKEGKKELESLLHFSTFKRGNTTEVQRLEIRSVLLAGVGLGASKEELNSLKDKLRNGTPEQTRQMLDALNDPKKLISSFKGEPSKLDPKTMPRLNITVPDAPNTLEVSVSTLQNLKGAQLVNFAVKSIITDGAPNQAPDLMRTKGENILLFTNQNKVSTELSKDKLVISNIEKAMNVDEARKKNGVKVNFGEDLVNIVSKTPSTAVLGTGKCGEHAAMSFALLTDPLSRKQMGVDLKPGTQIILALGDQIDHNYVLIAEPGSVDPVNSTKTTAKRINVKDSNKVVVVDPWMPIPTSHTLDRCNGDIQTKAKNKHEAVWKLIVVIQDDGSPAILDKHKDTGENVLTPIPSFGDTSTLDQLKGLQEKYQSGVKQRALVKGIVPLDEEVRLVTGSGVAVRDGAGKAGLYTNSHLSTNTPSDRYQAVDKDKNLIGDPVDLFVGQQSYVEKEYPNIERALDTTVKEIVKDKLEMLPQDLRNGVEIVLKNTK